MTHLLKERLKFDDFQSLLYFQVSPTCDSWLGKKIYQWQCFLKTQMNSKLFVLREQNYCEKSNEIMTELCGPLAGKLLSDPLDTATDEYLSVWRSLYIFGRKSLVTKCKNHWQSLATCGTSSSLNLCQTPGRQCYYPHNPTSKENPLSDTSQHIHKLKMPELFFNRVKKFVSLSVFSRDCLCKGSLWTAEEQNQIYEILYKENYLRPREMAQWTGCDWMGWWCQFCSAPNSKVFKVALCPEVSPFVYSLIHDNLPCS